MDSSDSTTTFGGTIVVGVIIFILLIAVVGLFYYLATQPANTPFPRSPFNYGDTIQITPAIPAQYGGINPSPNQYLMRNNCVSNTGTCPNSPTCYQNLNPRSGNGGCALTFTGSKEDPSTKWILRQFDSNGGEDANQGFISGFGNRFFLQSATTDAQNIAAARVTFSPFDGNGCGQAGDRTFPFININEPGNCFDNQLIIYIEPSTQSDLYYILFPSQFGRPQCPGDALQGTPYQRWANDGIMSLRPFSQYQDGLNTYFPWDSNGNLNSNGPLLNTLVPTTPCPNHQIPPLLTPEVLLFKITKA